MKQWMSSSHYLTIQSALKNISKTHQFTNHWTHVSSLEQALKRRYILNGITISKSLISRSLAHINNDITCLSNRHPSGVYKTRYKGESYYYFQKGSLPPPKYQIRVTMMAGRLWYQKTMNEWIHMFKWYQGYNLALDQVKENVLTILISWMK